MSKNKVNDYDNVTIVSEPGICQLTLKTSSLAGVTLTEICRRFEDLLRGHSYTFDGSIKIVEPYQEIMEVTKEVYEVESKSKKKGGKK
jgi:hypothetical protein